MGRLGGRATPIPRGSRSRNPAQDGSESTWILTRPSVSRGVAVVSRPGTPSGRWCTWPIRIAAAMARRSSSSATPTGWCCRAKRGDDREAGGPVAAPSGRGAAMPPGPGAARESYVAWLRQVSEESARRRHVPWWRKHPAGEGLAPRPDRALRCAGPLRRPGLGMRLPGQAARRGGRPESGKGRWTNGAGAARSQSPGRR